MCGILGSFQQRNVDAALQSLHHRGPDHASVWSDDTILLGHTRLAIIDLSEHGQQPMLSASGRYVIVFNGEIYNYLTLKTLCGEASWRGDSDTEVLLALIEKFGIEETLPKLAGMFAMAIWDRQEHCLTLARDRLGEKPLYYGQVNQDFVFASELKAIRAMTHGTLRIDPSAVNQMLTFSYVPAPLSIYQNIHKLLPGHFIKVKYQQNSYVTSAHQYWSLDQSIHRPKFSTTFQTNKSDLDKLLTTVLQQEMISDVPLGAFLSGGIDSSLIVAKMQNLSSTPIKTFTIGFHEKQFNEADHAQRIAQHLKTDHHELILNATDLLSVIPSLPEIYDEPFADSSQLPTYFVAKMTREHVTVALSGDGGDELFGGYNRYIWAQKLWKILRWFPLPLRKVICNLKNIPGIPEKFQKLERLTNSRNPEELYFNLIKTKLDAQPRLSASSSSDFESYLDYMTFHDCQHYLPDDILVKVDRAGMSNSLETRAPFLHHQIVEFAMQLPQEQKIQGSKGKILLRSLLSDYIPESLWNRPKMGFGIPLRDWLRGPLREWAESLLSEEKLREHDLLPTHELRRKWQDCLTKTTSDHYELWNALMFQAWYQHWMKS